MKLFIVYLLACFFGATLMQKRTLQTQRWLLFGFCFMIAAGYFFFRQI